MSDDGYSDDSFVEEDNSPSLSPSRSPSRSPYSSPRSAASTPYRSSSSSSVASTTSPSASPDRGPAVADDPQPDGEQPSTVHTRDTYISYEAPLPYETLPASPTSEESTHMDSTAVSQPRSTSATQDRRKPFDPFAPTRGTECPLLRPVSVSGRRISGPPQLRAARQALKSPMMREYVKDIAKNPEGKKGLTKYDVHARKLLILPNSIREEMEGDQRRRDDEWAEVAAAKRVGSKTTFGRAIRVTMGENATHGPGPGYMFPDTWGVNSTRGYQFGAKEAKHEPRDYDAGPSPLEYRAETCMRSAHHTKAPRATINMEERFAARRTVYRPGSKLGKRMANGK